MVRLAPPSVSVAVLAVALTTSVPAAAQEPSLQLPAASIRTEAMELEAAPESPAGGLEVSPSRPSPLLPLYLSYATLQALDIHSTIGALDRGAVEGNPMMKSLTANPASLIAVKAASSAGVFYTTERLWRKNPAAAVVFMVAANSAMAWVVQHNYRTAR